MGLQLRRTNGIIVLGGLLGENLPTNAFVPQLLTLDLLLSILQSYTA